MAIQLSPQLHDALAHYAELETAVVTAGRQSRKLELVQSRRKFAEQIGLLGLLIAQDRALAGTPDKQQEMGRLFTAFRYALGQHQANWPAVRIDEDPRGYAQSAWEAYSKSDLFWEWCLANLEFHRSETSRPDRLMSPTGPRFNPRAA
ncbi:MAG: hypothetical protein J7494_00720 [Sphingobium sp.]|nr:hypothetical protein [Sphingobium sp.]